VFIKYDAEDGTKHRWDWDTVRILSSEAEAAERVTGKDWNDIAMGLGNASPSSLRAVAWVLMKRQQPTLRHPQFDPPISALGIRLNAGEREDSIRELESRQDLAPKLLEQLLKEIDDMATEEAAEQAEADAARYVEAEPVALPLDDSVPNSPGAA
jgi:hypothetical protein